MRRLGWFDWWIMALLVLNVLVIISAAVKVDIQAAALSECRGAP